MDRLSELQRRLPRDIFEYHIKILGIGKPDQSRNGLHRLLGLPQQFLRTADPGLVQVLTDGGLRLSLIHILFWSQPVLQPSSNETTVRCNY